MTAPPHDDGGREPGFVTMVAAGADPQEAWQLIRDGVTSDPVTRAMFADLESTEEGRAALDYARARWAAHGLPAPFDNLPGKGEPAGPR